MSIRRAFFLTIGILSCSLSSTYRDAHAVNGIWSQILGTRPTARSGHTACYDRQNKRMIVFGGRDSLGTLLNDVWALSLDCATPQWTQLSVSGGPPLGRADHTAIYDTKRNRMIVFGGEGEENEEDVVFDDLWSLSLPIGGTPTWSDLSDSTTGPHPCKREGHTAVYSGSQMIIFGGAVGVPNGVYYTNDTFALDLSTMIWTRTSMPTAHPPNMPPCDDPATCTLVAPDMEYCCPASYPPAQWYHAAIWDAGGGRMIIHGGSYDNQCPTGITWDHGCVQQCLVLYPHQNLYDIDWCEIFPDFGPSPRLENHRAVFDSRRYLMLAFGGDSCSNSSSDTTASLWAMNTLNSPVWSKLTPSGGPAKRSYSAAVYDSLHDRLVIFGGETGNWKYGDTWQLRFDTTPPATTADFNIASISGGVKFRWTAPGDNGSSGCAAASYEIRTRSGSEITEANWSSSTPVGPPPSPSGPSTPGQKDSITVSLGAGVYWYVALKTTDRTGNVSGVSNNACIKLGNPPEFCGGEWSAVPAREEASLSRDLAIFALRPNPAVDGVVEVSFTLADDSPAALKVFDLAGRLVETQDLTHLGPGAHEMRIGGRTKLLPGHYRVRIGQGGRSVIQSVIVIR